MDFVDYSDPNDNQSSDSNHFNKIDDNAENQAAKKSEKAKQIESLTKLFREVDQYENKKHDDLWETFTQYVDKFFKDSNLKLIIKSFKNIIKFKNSKKKGRKDFKKFMDNNVKNVLQSISTYFNFMLPTQIPAQRLIEQLLFKLVFSPSEDNTTTQIYSVYQMHDNFLFTQSSFVNFKSSTGSGKTRCAPFFFAIKAHQDKLKRPFFILTQPSRSIIMEKMKDFKNIMRNTVILVDNHFEMITYYSKFQTNKKSIKKPIIGLFSPHSLLTLINKAEKKKIDIFPITRFCLDEIHERSVDTDVLIATLSERMNQMMKNNSNFPLQLLMMSATPDPRILHCFKPKQDGSPSVEMFELPDSQLFPIHDIPIRTDSLEESNKATIEETLKIIKNMGEKKFEKGHILVFTSGNARIK